MKIIVPALIFFLCAVIVSAEPHKGATYPLESILPLCSEFIDPKDAAKYLHCPSGLVDAPSNKWQGYFEFMGKPGTARSLGQADLFVPLAQDKNDMFFFNLRGQMDDFDNSEYNIGFGHRHMFDKWIIGGYGYYDHRITESYIFVEQVTLGVEALSETWDLRGNGYIAEGGSGTTTSAEFMERPENPAALITAEKGLSGMDFEVGYKLPIPDFGDTGLFEDTRLYLGGYHFIGNDPFESVTGPRVRLETRIHDLPFLGVGSRLMVGLEAQYDKPRGDQTFGLVSLRIPFGVASKKTRTPLKGLDRRMMEPVVRDVDIVTGKGSVEVPVLHPNGKAYTHMVTLDASNTDAETANTGMADAVMRGHTPLGMVTDSEGNNTWSVENVEIAGGWTWANAGKIVKLRYKGPFGDGTINYTPAGKAPTITGITSSADSFLKMADGAHINGWDIDAKDHNYGIQSGTKGTYYATNIKVSNAKHNGVLVNHAEATLYLSDSEITNSGNGQVGTKNDGTLIADNLYVHNGKGVGVFIRQGGTVRISNSTVSKNKGNGLSAQDGGTMIADKMVIDGNGEVGVEATDDGTFMTVTRSTISNNDYGVMANAGQGGKTPTIILGDVTIENNKVGIMNYGARIEITNSRIINNIAAGYEGESFNGFITPHYYRNNDINQGAHQNGALVLATQEQIDAGLAGIHEGVYKVYLGYMDKHPSLSFMKNVTITGNGIGILNAGGNVIITGNSNISNNGWNNRQNYFDRSTVGEHNVHPGGISVNGKYIEKDKRTDQPN